MLSLLQLSVVPGIDPRAGQFLVLCLSCHSRWVCSYPAVLRLLHQESPFSWLNSAALPPTFHVGRGALLLLGCLLGAEAADWNGCSAPGSQPQLSLLRVEAAARSSLALLIAAGLKASTVCSP